MLGPSHALSGAAAWLAGSFVAEHLALTHHLHQTPTQLVIGTAMCAGGALLPDLDMSGKVLTDQGGATVAHTFGRASLFTAECVEKASLGIYDVTRTRRDPRRHNGHRTFTHTLPFAALIGFGLFELCWHFGKYAVLATLFVTFAGALRGLFPSWSKRVGWIFCTICAGFVTWWAADHLAGGRGYPILGFAIGAGCIVHLLGDMLTVDGCPVLWPIPYHRRMWFDVGVPNPVAVQVGGKVETHVLRPLFFLIGLAAAIGLSGHWVSEHVDRLQSMSG